MSHNYLYAVYDSEGNFVKAYAYHTWANRKALEIGGTVETYVYTKYRFGIEVAELLTRGE